jgi:hypothetical protein
LKKSALVLPLSLASQAFDSGDKGHVWLSSSEFLPEVPLLEKVFGSDDYTELSNLSVKADELLVASCRLKEEAPALWTAKI